MSNAIHSFSDHLVFLEFSFAIKQPKLYPLIVRASINNREGARQIRFFWRFILDSISFPNKVLCSHFSHHVLLMKQRRQVATRRCKETKKKKLFSELLLRQRMDLLARPKVELMSSHLLFVAKPHEA